MIKKVEKLHAEVTKFMVDFQCSANQNIEAANKVITSLDTTLQTERESLSRIHGELKDDNFEMNAFIVSKIEKLQQDLVAQSVIMDKLAVKTEKAKVHSLKLNYANKHLDDLETEKEVIKSYLSEINQYLHCLVETQDSILTISVRQFLPC